LNLQLFTRLYRKKKLWLSELLLIQTIIKKRRLKNLRGGLISNLLPSVVSKLTKLAYGTGIAAVPHDLVRISHGHTIASS